MNMELPEPTTSLVVQPKSSWSRRYLWWIVGGCALLLVIAAVLASFIWYTIMLKPAMKQGITQNFAVKSGDTAVSVGTRLEEAHLIKNELAFVIYIRLHGGELKIGNYRLSPEATTPEIATHLLSGKQDSYDITFFPGATLQSPVTTPEDQRTDVTTVLERVGFSADDVKSALAASYSSPLFADKPAGSSLEGYVYGQTYQVNVGTSAQAILQRSFDTFWQVLQENNLPAKFQAHGLNLYQAITLASIVQREADRPADQQQIAQVFYSRLAQNMMLGSDVTFIYAANQLGIVPSPTLDSPYNTRIHTGLPPGPIAAPGLTALEAVADPAPGDYLYFIAGDDGTVHFAHTEAEHQENIAKYCQKLCQ